MCAYVCMCMWILLVLWTLSLSRDQTFLFQYVLWHCNLLSHDNWNGILKYFLFCQVRRFNSYKCLWPNPYCVQLCQKKKEKEKKRSHIKSAQHVSRPFVHFYACLHFLLFFFSSFLLNFLIAANISIVQVATRCCEYWETVFRDRERKRKREREKMYNLLRQLLVFITYITLCNLNSRRKKKH